MEKFQLSNEKLFLTKVLDTLHRVNSFVRATIQDITIVNNTLEYYVGSKWFHCNLEGEIIDVIRSVSKLYNVHYIIKSEYNIVLKHDTPTTCHYYENNNKHSYPEFTNPLHVYCKTHDIEIFDGIASRYHTKKYGTMPNIKFSKNVKKYVHHYHIREWVKELQPLYTKFKQGAILN